MSTLIHVDLQRSFPRVFVPENADMGDWAQIEPLFTALLGCRPASLEELEQWLTNCSELWSALWEEKAKRSIAVTSQTDDPVREVSYRKFVEEIEPRAKTLAQALEKAYLENPLRKRLPSQRFAVMDRKIENNVALFREKNVPLETQDSLLRQDYHKIMGAMTVSVDGVDLTLEQASKYLDDPDRAVRERVWRQIVARRLEDKEALEEIFDRLVALRTEIAANADFPNYRDYMFRRLERFDYTSEDCFRFHDGVESAVLPVFRNILLRRQKLLKVDRLRPWDRDVDPLHRPPLRPFTSAAELVHGTHEVFTHVHPALAKQFRFMADHGLLATKNAQFPTSRSGSTPNGVHVEYTTPHDNAHFLWLDKYPFGDEDSCLEFRISKTKPRVSEGQKATGPS